MKTTMPARTRPTLSRARYRALHPALYRVLILLTGLLTGLLTTLPALAYLPIGPWPQWPKPGTNKLWTDADVDRVVDVSYVRIDAIEPASTYGAPAACDKVGFLRVKAKDASDDAEQADAAFLMVPGILEGADGFWFLARQMVYLAKTEYGRNIEVWAMDRRANCLEDLTGMQAAEQATTVQQAEDTLIGYYYKHQAIDGKQFAGFLTSAQMPYLYDFGMRQVTLDMYAIIRHMMPDADVRKRKVFVGGHSLGGIHTSVFLSWNFSGDPADTADAGYNQVAGAFGLETYVDPVDATTPGLVRRLLPTGAMNLPGTPTPAAQSQEQYQRQLDEIQSGTLPREVFIPGLFGPEVIAMPEALGLLADLAPTAESDVLSKLPKPLSPELDGVLRLMHCRNLVDYFNPPDIQDFRYTNQAYVGLFFDDNFSALSFLQAGLGFIYGGPVTEKQYSLELLAQIPGLNHLITGIYGSQLHYIATDAGPSLQQLGTGPLYQWTPRDQIGSPSAPNYTNLDGRQVFTYLGKEPSDIRDFSRALHAEPTNLTEWYFPTRIVVDSGVIGASYVQQYGLDIVYPDGVREVPSLVIDGDQGLTGHKVGDPPAFPEQQLIVAPGFHHLDPLFESVNSPTQNDYVVRPLIEFALAHAH